MIHVCFSLHTYFKFMGTAMLSLFENTNSKLIVHILHSNIVTNDSRDKLIQIAERYGHSLKFYNVDELCADRIAKIKEFFPNLDMNRYSFATFYRLFTPHLLPKGIEKTIYLDSDIIVNLDISELWQVELAEHPLGAVPEIHQFKDKNAAIKNRKHYAPILDPEDYFNAGVMLMNLKILRKEEATIQAGMKFISEHASAYPYNDQDILNYCFSTSYLKLPLKFNQFVFRARNADDWTIDKEIYHYAGGSAQFNMNMNDPYNKLFMDYFIKTPWVDDDTCASLNGGAISPRRSYLVSVIIPMYNMAEYIGECLDSLLIQTFQDFEVIVVDDCSTDNSVGIVEEYAPKFNGRLKLTKTEKNSCGGGNVPRNVGLMLARGDYVYFMDADDMILDTALETFYKAAILYDADVVYTASRYDWNGPNDIYLRKDDMSRKLRDINTELTIDEPNKNLSQLLIESGEGNFRACWTKFVRRDFLIENQIFFPNVPNAGDFIWAINMYCHAKRFLRISVPLYFYRRYNENSIIRTLRVAQEHCRYWLFAFVSFVKALRELEKETEVLLENPLYCLAASNKAIDWTLRQTTNARKELDSEELYKILHSEFLKSSDDSLAVLVPFLFSFIDNDKKAVHAVEPISKFKPFITARIDMKLTTTKGDFQIVSVSDRSANVTKPAWFQKDGIGYVIQSYTGKQEIVAKATVDGTIIFWLRGVDVRDPKDKSKRIPYWIDYTNFTINGKTILDKVTPTWHDESYRYTLNVKANEEIKIQVEWLPHRVDAIELPSPKAPEPKVETPPIKSDDNTARLDIKMIPETAGGDFQIVSISDDKAEVQKPAWLQKKGVGYQIQSYVGKLELVAKSTADGKVNCQLKGIDVKSPNKSKRIPHWIDYTKLTINGKKIFNTVTPAWHDEFYSYTFVIKAGEEIRIQVEWLPHKDDT